MKISMLAILLVGIGATVTAAGFNQLGGDLPPRLTAVKSPYLVVSDIYVAAGRVTMIEAGCVFLFKNFTGLKVQGVLSAQGTPDRPVVFTSEFDTVYNRQGALVPNPYDWNGMYIDKDGLGTDLRNVQVRYTVFGITSLTRFIRIDNGIFTANGRANLTIEGSAKEVGDAPFSYAVSVKDATVDGVPVRILADPLAVKRTVLRFGGAGVFVGGCILGGVFTGQTIDAQSRLRMLSDRADPDNLYYNDNSAWAVARDSRNVDVALMCIGYLAAICGAAGFGWSFTF